MIFSVHPDGNMKPSQLSLFPTAQADTWRYSDEDACYSCNRRVFNLPDGKASVSNVLEFAKDTDTWHPTQKPLALIAHLIRQYSNQGDTVLDNCMGSATTAVAAIRTGRNWIGYEMNTEFYNRALKRIDETMRTPTLF